MAVSKINVRLFKKYPLFWFFLLGLILRLSLLFFDYAWDVNNHIVWAKDLWNRGFKGFFDKQSSEVFATVYPNYPPLSLFLFYLIYPLQGIIYKIIWWLNLSIPLFPSNLVFFVQEKLFLAGLMKLPAVFADLGIAWLFYLFSKKITSNNATSQLVTFFILFNPAFIFNSALWGQIDSIPIFFALSSVYFLLYSNNYLLSAFLFLGSILIKPTTLVYLPVYLIFFISKYKFIKSLKALLLNLFIFYLSFLPFFPNFNNPLLPFTIFNQKIMAAQSLPYIANGAFNFWLLISRFAGIKASAAFILGVSYQVWGFIITGFLISFIVLKLSRQNIFFALFLSSFAGFIFLTKMHERYSLLLLPFLLLSVIKNKKLVNWFIVLSVISLLNHYHSWTVPKLGFFTVLLNSSYLVFTISLINLILFVALLIRWALAGSNRV